MFTFGLTIVRHGETQYNKDKLLQGQGVDLPLSATGLQQAESVGNYLRDLKFTNAFVSDLQRARQTANIIVRNNLHCSGIEMVTDSLLKERSFGIAEGRPVDDLKNMARAAGQSCPNFTPPGGETPEQVKLRIEEFLRVLFLRMVADHCSADGQGDRQRERGSLGLRERDRRAPRRPARRRTTRHARPRPGASHLFSACPNTGICRFVFTLRLSDTGPAPVAVRCVFINRKDHLRAAKGAE
ncbi:hypothetical protein AAFF_G00097000 [Aldrovandia affinis]|uniref:Fructose-2,6-bisphosphatase TIGAR n=1 Tax=Aldrovandia affinis TaxID=143900 RepID=A0AAD7WCP0_9TELE|nr:hypothetical protein AAFF_G00097000 [Aldrovandia affinis]